MRIESAWKFEEGSRGVLAAGRGLRLRAVLWALFLSAVVMALFLSTQYVRSWLHLPANSSYAIDFGVPILAFIIYAFAIRTAEQRSPVEVLPNSKTVGEILVGTALGISTLALLTVLLWSLGLYQIKPNHWSHAFDSFVFGSYLSGMMEELLFRAILLRILARAFSPIWGLVLSSVLFGLAHLTHGSWIAVTEIAINAGMVLGLLYMVTGRLWMSIAMHIAWDFFEDSIIGVNGGNGLFLSTPTPGKSALLTGGTYGPDGSVLAMIIGALTCVALLWVSSRGCLIRSHDTSLKGL